MSHLSTIKTSLKNLDYLEKSLKDLDINYELDSSNAKLVIYQKSNNIEFSWNGKEFELITDLSFWEQKFSIDEFLKRLISRYTYYTVSNESKILGFEKIKEEDNVILLERWV